MHLDIDSCVIVPSTIVLGYRSNQDEKQYCDGFCGEISMEGFIIVARNYPVIIVGIICLCQSVVHGLNRV